MTKEVSLHLPSNKTSGNTILRLPCVKYRTGLGRASIYAGVKNGTFPAQIKLGERAVGWLESSVDAWIAARIAASQADIKKATA